MKYAVHSSQNVMQIDLEGVLTFIDAHTFTKLMGLIACARKMSEVHINIRLLQKVDASGLDMLMQAHDAAKRNHLALIFEDPQGQVREALYKAAACNSLCIAA